MIERPQYLNNLIALKDTNLIKVLVGVRRCGKSTLLKLYRKWLEAQGVLSERIVAIDLDLFEFEELREYHALHDYVKAHLIDGQQTYVFIDEIQRCAHFEDAIESLFAAGFADIYLTGSNARLFSAELATLLSGRYAQIEILPFSFREYLIAQSDSQVDIQKSQEEYFADYLRYGSFPEITNLPANPQIITQYLEGIYNTVLVNDVVERHGIRDVTALKRIARFLFDNVGSLTSANSISNTLVASGHKLSQPTVDSYLEYFCASFLFYAAQRFDVKGKENLRSLSKYYAVDLGLRNHILGFRNRDRGYVLENIVFLELRRRGYDVHVGKLYDKEIDFVAQRAQEMLYVQIAETVIDPAVLERELKPLQKADGYYGRLLLTRDYGINDSYEGIAHRNIIEWLLEDY